MTEKTIVSVPVLSDVMETVGVPLSLAVRAGDMLYCSGMPPFDPKTGALIKGDIVVQTRAVLEALKHVLESAGSSLDRVVKTTVFATNAAYFDRINEVYRAYFPTNPPARSFVVVGSWPREFDIEIECVALA